MIEFKNYRRFFAFGCSFTSYCPPTWADILASEMPTTEYYNFGAGGGGNLMINNRVAQANLKFKFDENDLVIVMFTTMCREDRYIRGLWRAHGNVYNQEYYDRGFVKKYCDPIGYLVRDMALLEMTQAYLNSLPCKTLFLSLTDLSDNAGLLVDTTLNENDPTLYKVKQIYGDINFPFMVGKVSTGFRGLTFKDNTGKERNDGHPITQDHLDFLLKYNFPITERGKSYVADMMNRVENANDWNELYGSFPEIKAIKDKSERAII